MYTSVNAMYLNTRINLNLNCLTVFPGVAAADLVAGPTSVTHRDPEGVDTAHGGPIGRHSDRVPGHVTVQDGRGPAGTVVRAADHEAQEVQPARG